MVVVSGGSWAIGDLARTVEVLAQTGRFTPVVLCGRDTALQARIEAAGGIGMGWIDDVPALLAAADALVDNAGGLTCMEAFAVGTPVVSFRPIAGHGRHNAAEMQRAGVSRYPRSASGLVALLDSMVTTPERHEALVTAASMMFSGDAAKDIIDLASGNREAGNLRPPRDVAA
jgi:UDP-N-acetylglucosamine:LPS N-acetylglucosamine transferase